MVEQCGGIAFAEQVDATIAECRTIAVGVVIAVQQVDVVATLFAPGGEQRVGVLVQGLRIDGDRHAGFTGLAVVFVSEQVFVGDDGGPMVATRVVHAEQDLAETGQARECFQSLGWQGGNPENDHSGWQANGGFFEAIDALDKALVNAGTALCHTLFSDIE